MNKGIVWQRTTSNISSWQDLACRKELIKLASLKSPAMRIGAQSEQSAPVPARVPSQHPVGLVQTQIDFYLCAGCPMAFLVNLDGLVYGSDNCKAHTSGRDVRSAVCRASAWAQARKPLCVSARHRENKGAPVRQLALTAINEEVNTHAENLTRIAMIGAGYVGLVSGACFADASHCQVVCVDSNASKIEALKRGEMPIYEPELAELVQRNVASGRLRFSNDLSKSVREAQVVFIAVGTPSRRGDGHADLSYVFRAAEAIGENLRAPGFTLIVNKSTVPVGTARRVRELVARNCAPGAYFEVVSNPEFLRQGTAVRDFMYPKRVVIGIRGEPTLKSHMQRVHGSERGLPSDPEDPSDTDTRERARKLMSMLYAPIAGTQQAPVLFTNVEEAEMIKYAANAFLAMKLEFTNEIADLCEVAGADISTITHAIGLDGRIGADYLQAGPGFGGSCLPKDTRALARIAQEFWRPCRLVETVIEGNEARKRRIAQRIALAAVAERADMNQVYGRCIGVLGLTFKAHTDDVRDSPAVFIVRELIELGAKVRAYDPRANHHEVRQVLGEEVELVHSVHEAAKGADVLAVLTEWPEFREACAALGPQGLGKLMRQRVLFDARNLWRPTEWQHSGFTYHSIGRPTLQATTAENIDEVKTDASLNVAQRFRCEA
jgi:UDPglucose 6-dehydrogenase